MGNQLQAQSISEVNVVDCKVLKGNYSILTSFASHTKVKMYKACIAQTLTIQVVNNGRT